MLPSQPQLYIETSNNFKRNRAKRVQLGQVEKFSFSQIPSQQEFVTGDGNVMHCRYGCSLQLGGSAIESCVHDNLMMVTVNLKSNFVPVPTSGSNG